MNTIYHKCTVLDTFKVSKTRTLLRCIVCNKVVAEWEDKIYPRDQQYSVDLLESLT